LIEAPELKFNSANHADFDDMQQIPFELNG